MDGLKGILEASWVCLETSRGHLGHVLHVPWGKRQKKFKVDILFVFWRAKAQEQIVKSSCLRINLYFMAFLKMLFVIFHVFESQLVMTCSGRILAKHWLGARIKLHPGRACTIIFAK